MAKKIKKGIAPKHDIQTLLVLKPITEVEVDGVGMGVLPDGTPYLTARGLARMCGIDHTKILEVANNWSSEQFKPRGEKIANLLQDQGFDKPALFVQIEIGGSTHHAFTDVVCMAFLEYYAFEAGSNNKSHALKNFRLLAKSSFRVFIYAQVGYDPSNKIPVSWKQFHDRVSLTYNKIPDGYFSIFKEIANMVVAMIQAGVPVDEKTVPDISVGSSWANHWCDSNFETKHGSRKKYEHNYPHYFPQAKSNPQYPWVYPDAALGEFRRWLREVYFPQKFESYINAQANKRALPPSIAQMAINAVVPKKLKQPDLI